MATDIFGRRPLEFGGAFAADAAAVGFTSTVPDFGSGVGMVTQNMQVSYQQPINRLYEVGTQKTYYVAGRPQGQINLARILGPGRVAKAFYSALGNVCNANGNHMSFSVAVGCLVDVNGNVQDQGPALIMYALNVLLQSIGMSVAAQDMVINEQLSLFFTALLAEEDSSYWQRT